jgi:signal transduction histidine kinase
MNRNDRLHRYYFYAILSLFIVYAVIQSSLSVSTLRGDICEVYSSDEHLENESWFDSQIEGSAFAAFLMVYIIKSINEIGKGDRNRYQYLSIYAIPLSICLIQLISTIVGAFSSNALHCTSIFGVGLPLQIWIEWLISLPFLTFMTTAINPEIIQCASNQLIVVSMSIASFSILCTSFLINQAAAYICLVISLSAYLLAVVSSLRFRRIDTKSILPSTFDLQERDQSAIEWKTAEANIRIFLLAIVPFFLILHILASGHVVSREASYLAFTMTNIVTKIGYSSYLCDSHITMLESIAAFDTATTFGQSSRKEFMRYVFHELRNPLNSIALGIDLLHKQHEDEETADLSTISLITESVSYIVDTLADVSQLNCIEDGGFALSNSRFPLKESIHRVLETVQSLVRIKHVQLQVIVAPTVPLEIIADRERLELIISKFISYSVRRSTAGGKVTLHVEYKPITPKHIGQYPAGLLSSKFKDLGKSAKKTFFERYADGNSFSGRQVIAAAVKSRPFTSSSIDTAPMNHSSLAPPPIRLIFHILDDCPGLGPEELNQLFKPFASLQANDMNNQTSGPANGLGLALARDIIEALGGNLEMIPSLDANSFGVKLGFAIPIELPAGFSLPTFNRSASMRSSVVSIPRSTESSGKKMSRQVSGHGVMEQTKRLFFQRNGRTASVSSIHSVYSTYNSNKEGVTQSKPMLVKNYVSITNLNHILEERAVVLGPGTTPGPMTTGPTTGGPTPATNSPPKLDLDLMSVASSAHGGDVYQGISNPPSSKSIAATSDHGLASLLDIKTVLLVDGKFSNLLICDLCSMVTNCRSRCSLE